MARSPARKKKDNKAGRPRTRAAALPPLDPLRPGMPALDSITGVKEVERDGEVFRIIQTDETDAYDKPVKSTRKRGPKR